MLLLLLVQRTTPNTRVHKFFSNLLLEEKQTPRPTQREEKTEREAEGKRVRERERAREKVQKSEVQVGWDACFLYSCRQEQRYPKAEAKTEGGRKRGVAAKRYMRNICHVIIIIILEQQYDSFIYINTYTHGGHIQLSIEILVCKAASLCVFAVACLVGAQHTPNTRRRHAHAHTGTAYAESCWSVASRRVAASLTAAALPSQYFIWHLNQILLVFCCHSRRRLPRTPTATATELATATASTTTTATLILARLDTQTVHEYLSTCSQTLFSAHAHTRTHTQSRTHTHSHRLAQ